MSVRILEGKVFAAQIKQSVKVEVEKIKATQRMNPGLAVIIVGENPASKVYVANKHKACEELGIYSEVISLPESISKEELLAQIISLNENPAIHGILLQLPLPEALKNEEAELLKAIHPDKDVDGFHPVNVGKLAIGQEHLVPCTPAGCIKMLELANVEIAGKHAVIIGRSNIVGKPMANLLLARHATVTICHSRTADLSSITRQADILIVAIGKAQFVTADMVKPGAVVIDVGINRLPDKKLVGDVDFEQVKEVAGAITPVPGGVGLLTIAMLLSNTVKAATLLHVKK
ncbi:bifunctional methylenetetrahydrofolate dehydrogenase/methenyltetrahydrofolate cyclohydrolase FolD [Pelosinus sp. IPA-1]|uniref:bifunctional methylenetetrahydrofolate dehydrogenase/methenyltetrahydrofolate cyclohydrolase FolD n=1 Tax=Pelosinus sp. IPA-1 TaxID=3029569 RepID=UPI00243614C9|nr:bifunctional methylenetetrahydrofolate dehydrogenase/methenyltetrahydrofolate cyclohydrolase FolD [Pelosinus sp. IPA-1]GMB01870.1 bifunctional protein FolD [Pelosinus sp. IPA-1]